MKTSEKIYWIKVILGIATGAVCFIANSMYGLQGELSFVIGTTLYLTFSEALAMVFKVDRNRVLKIAIGGFIFLWLLTWTLLNTLGISLGWFA